MLDENIYKEFAVNWKAGRQIATLRNILKVERNFTHRRPCTTFYIEIDSYWVILVPAKYNLPCTKRRVYLRQFNWKLFAFFATRHE